jgi:hypothetical protein
MAWAVLLISFFSCITLAVTLPLGARYFLLNAQVSQNVALEVQRPPLRVTLAGRGVPVAIAEDRGEIPEGTIVTTDSTYGQLVMHTHHAQGPVVARVQIYDNTEVVLEQARSPRFPMSPLPHQVRLAIQTGRVRISVLDDDGRPATLEVETPHGSASLTTGSYEVKVNGTKVEVTARNGYATIHHPDEETLRIGPTERAIIHENVLNGPLPAARNLVTNGDFQQPLEEGWTSYIQQTDLDQPPASVGIAADQGIQVINFQRSATNHAEGGVRQIINYDVRDFSFLELRLAVRINSQDITGFGGCGYLSSECPVSVVMEYKDIHGSDREWRHGFYTGEPAPDWPLYPWTEQIPAGTWQTYESGNLMEELEEAPPAFIKSLTIYASGHSFHSMVTDVELLAEE